MRRILPLVLVVAAVTAADARAAGNGATLAGTVGPGFTITLTAHGAAVKTLTAGTYRIEVRDLSAAHDFHLFGPGVSKRTSVAGTGSTTWTVRLQAGVYQYQCDPHKAFMHGRFTVR